MHDDILKEAKRLYDIGFAIHWIKPKSKAPVKSGWALPTRDIWPTVSKEYRKGYGLGVRLGEASNLGEGYLANIDVDIKSKEPRHRQEALAFVRKEFPGLLKTAPVVKTGNGLRIFVQTREPLRSGKLTSSSETCIVHMPTADINRQQQNAVRDGLLSQKKLDAGWRIRPAWEVEFMSIGKQVVLPPSIHPDTGKPYTWTREITGILSIPLIRLDALQRKRPAGRPQGSHGEKFTPTEVDLIGSRLSAHVVQMIRTGEDVDDRSAACFTASIAMVRAGFSDDEILSVLTDRDNFLGETAYDHRKTSSRSMAAAWVRDYCIRKAKEEVDATNAFASAVEVSPVMSDGEAQRQNQVLFGKKLKAPVAGGAGNAKTKAVKWTRALQRSGKDGDGPPKATLENTVLVLVNAVAADVFKLDMFARREFYGCDAPWTGGEAGKALEDVDAVNIKLWCAEAYGFEPAVSVVFEAMQAISSQNAFHPVRDELEALEEWDGEERLATWLSRGFNARGADAFLSQVMTKWLVASITRVYRPGAKFDWMPIFEGKQGVGKSSFGSILFGQKYFSDWLPALSDKDAALGLEGKRCVEFGELDGLRRNEIETTKAFVTRQIDNVRPPYGRKQLELHRQCVFFGTTNKQAYFRDDTGNRRFIPVEVGRLDFELLRRERDQLWAEALFLYRNELVKTLDLEGEAAEEAEKAQRSKLVEDESAFMVSSLKRFIATEKAKPRDERFDFSKFKLVSLFEGTGPLGGTPQTARSIQMAGKALSLIMARKRKIRGEHWWKVDF